MSVLTRSKGIRIPVRDSAAALRLDVVRTLARFGLQPSVTIALVVAHAQRPFPECRPCEIVPALEDLLALAYALASGDQESGQ